jgi:hypothetical protein
LLGKSFKEVRMGCGIGEVGLLAALMVVDQVPKNHISCVPNNCAARQYLITHNFKHQIG